MKFPFIGSCKSTFEDLTIRFISSIFPHRAAEWTDFHCPASSALISGTFDFGGSSLSEPATSAGTLGRIGSTAAGGMTGLKPEVSFENGT